MSTPTGTATAPLARLAFLHNRGPQAATVVAAALAALQLALLAWHFVPTRARHLPPAAPLAPAGPDLNALTAAHLFGASNAAATDAAEAPRTAVALVLTGTLAVRDPGQGLAIIGETAQNARVYAVGAGLPGGVRLHEVYPDRVVLDRDGSLETLPLPRELAGLAPAAAPRPARRGEPALAENVQRLVAQGPELIGEVLRPMPAYANGQLRGFTVYPGKDRGKFGRLGLHAGDLVTQINGVPLSDPQRGMEILRTLGSNGASQVTVERAGATVNVSVDAAQIDALTQPAEGAAAGAEPPAATSK